MRFRISLDQTFDVGSDAGETVSRDCHLPLDFAHQIDRIEMESKDWIRTNSFGSRESPTPEEDLT